MSLLAVAWLLIAPHGVPGEARCLAVAPGECVQVTVTGQGPDVVIVPGLFGSAFSFRHIIPRLSAAGYRSIVIEPLGVGDSARPRGADYSLTAQAERIRRALDALEVEQPIVVAHSIGSSIALRLASRHPDRVRALVSLEGGPAEQVATSGFRRAMKLRPLLRLLGAGPLRSRIRSMLVSRSGDPSWVTDDVVASYAAGPMRDLGATLHAFGQMAKAREPEALASRLAVVRCPVLLLVGEVPHVGGPSEAEIALLHRTLPSFTLERIPGAGHFLFEEDPEAVLAAIARMAGPVPSGLNSRRFAGSPP
jgi:pimeloyl-ACP methyl ester carboxylesterase